MSAPPRPTPAPRPQSQGSSLESVLVKEQTLLAACTLAAGVMAGFQLPASSLDVTFKDPTLQAVVGVAWGLVQTFYAAAAKIPTDTSWVDPLAGTTPKPAPPPAPPAVVNPTSVQPSVTALLQSMQSPT